jgi:short-subunit dehydrogenase
VTRPLALVTGASAGIGRELAKLLAADGYDLVLVARRADELHALAGELSKAHGITAHVLPADLADPAASGKLFDEVTAKGLTVEVLVNNAGFGLLGPFAAADLGRTLALVQVNVVALTHLTGLFLPGMVQRRRGRVLNVGSTAAFQPGPLMAVYYATKAYVLSFSEALSKELEGTGVTVTCLCPGPTTTEFGGVSGMAETVFFRGPNVMAVGPVAAAGYRGLMRGKRLVVPGLMNRLLVTAGRFVPRGVLLGIVKRFQENRR